MNARYAKDGKKEHRWSIAKRTASEKNGFAKIVIKNHLEVNNMNECVICKHHYSQNGRCHLQVRNCLQFEEEPRGKIVYKKVKCKFSLHNEQRIELNKEYEFIEERKGFEAEVIKINYVDFESGIMGLEIRYHENDWIPKADKRKIFRILK